MTAKKKVVLVLWLIAIVALAIVIGHWRANTGLADFKTEAVSDSYYVQDNAKVLQEDTVKDIIKQNQALYRQNGGQIVVVTEQNLGGVNIAEYAANYFQEKKIGSAAYNNGFLLLLAIEEDSYYALPGAGLDTAFSVEALNGLFTSYLEADFAEKNYDSGVSNFFEQICKTMKAQDFTKVQVPEVATSNPAFPLKWVLFIIVGFVILLAFSGRIARIGQPKRGHVSRGTRSPTQHHSSSSSLNHLGNGSDGRGAGRSGGRANGNAGRGNGRK